MFIDPVAGGIRSDTVKLAIITNVNRNTVRHNRCVDRIRVTGTRVIRFRTAPAIDPRSHNPLIRKQGIDPRILSGAGKLQRLNERENARECAGPGLRPGKDVVDRTKA